ncbi:MAG: low molecular weight phosphotyrosine protein phosphatase [Pararhodobacter sp.]|nr:low molecular weight phosphotyrosine protein phosphatase [Pararhodobacter sp.]
MRVLLLCLGNICRSPTAHGVLRAMARERGMTVEFDSAGTGDWHLGSPPDHRTLAAARKRGYDFSDLRARQLTRADFTHFNLILAMDAANLRDARALAPETSTAHLTRFLEYAGLEGDVPDPYFTGSFDAVLDLIERSSIATLDRLSRDDLP